MKQDKIIDATKYWLENIIIEFNFCPFAKREFINQTIRYHVCSAKKTAEENDLELRLACLEKAFLQLDEFKEIETTLVIYPFGLESFFDYIDFLAMANELLVESNYEGKYQLASFHPDYCFEDVKQDDASNYTNRSPLPMIHILREESIEKVLANFDNPDEIPNKNISFARAQGSQFFEQLIKRLP